VEARIFAIFVIGSVMVAVVATLEFKGRMRQQDDASDMRASRVLTSAMILSTVPGQVLGRAHPQPAAVALDLPDPDFDPRAFSESIRRRFLDVVDAVRRGDLSGVEPFLDEHSRCQLEARVRKPSGPLSESEVRAVVPISLEVSGAVEKVRVRIDLETYRLWRAHDATPHLGEHAPGFRTAEVWTIVRQRPSAGVIGLQRAPHCPHCGAALPMSADGRCPYCDERVERARPEAYGWILHDIATGTD